MLDLTDGPPVSGRLVIGSRRSSLARIQAEWVGDRLREAWPRLTIEYQSMSTEGDRRPEAAFPRIGIKGLFTRDLERALAEKRIDLAVHSLKDLPADAETERGLAAVPIREDPRDVLVMGPRHVDGLAIGSGANGGASDGAAALASLPPGAVVGTASIRRASQLRTARPDLLVEAVRGNVETRLARLAAGHVDALVLAAAGLRRLDRRPLGAVPLDGDWLPAPGQGALGVQGRVHDATVRAWAAAIDDPVARAETRAERALLRALDGGCQVPVAARARVDGERLGLTAAVYDVSGGSPVVGGDEGSVSEAEVVGRRLADRLREEGAGELVAAARRQLTG